MKKIVKVLLVAFVLIVAIVLSVGLYFYWPYLQTEPSAVLSVEKGVVSVDFGAGFIEVKNWAQLKKNDVIRTNAESEAEVIFLGLAAVRLDELSSVIIKDIDAQNRTINLEQGEGDVWFEILDGSGVKIELNTPDGNFTNEGTSFGSSVSIARPRFVLSAPKLTRTIGTVIPVLRGSVIQRTATNVNNRISTGTQGTIINSNPIKINSIVKNRWVIKNENKYDYFVKKRREYLKKKYARNLQLITTLFPQVTNDALNVYIDKILKGEIKINDKIKDGTIPEKVKFLIPPELIIDTPIVTGPINPTGPTQVCPKRYSVQCGLTLACTLIYSIPDYMENYREQGLEKIKNYIKGSPNEPPLKGVWLDKYTYKSNFENEVKAWGVGCSCYEALTNCVKNSAESNTRSTSPSGGPGDYLAMSRSCSATKQTQLSCTKIN